MTGGLHTKQLESVRRAQSRINVWEGSVRSGKTIGSIDRWLRYVAVDGPPGALLMVGKTERTIERNVLAPIKERIGERRCVIRRGVGEVHLLGRTVYLMGANDEAAAGKLRGITLAGAYGDEFTLWPESFFKMLLSRLSVEGAKLFGSTNPDGPRHWFKTGVLDRADDLDLARFHFRLEDNPSNDPAYVAALKAEYTGLWRQRFIEGLWVAAEGAIYPDLDTEPGGPHVRAHDPTTGQLDAGWVAVDYGTANPFHALRIRRRPTPKGHDLHVSAEWRHASREAFRQMTDAQYADALEAWWGDDQPPTIVVDPSAASFIAELRQRGHSVLPAENAVLDGIRTVASMLTAGRLTIDPSCRHLLDEMAGYVWDPKATARGEDAPVKADDHGPDALRYGVMADAFMGPVVMVDTGWG